MDTQRLILFMVFTMSVFLLMEAWQRENTPPLAEKPAAPALKSDTAATPVPSPSKVLTPAPAGPPAGSVLQKGDRMRVETDLMVVDIDTAGGDIRRVEFLHHRDTIDRKKNFVLLEQGGERTYIAQSGLIGKDLPNHRTHYKAEQQNFKLVDGADTLTVRLTANTMEGVYVIKSYTFHRGSYVIDTGYELENRTAAPIPVHGYFQLVRDGTPPAGDSAMLPTYTGVALYTDKEKFTKVAFGDMDKNKANYPKNSNDGWIGMVQHYFLSAWLPPDKQPREFYAQRLENGLYAAGLILSAVAIEPGSRGVLGVPLYVGPQEQDKLSKLAPGLELTVDYGMLTVIAAPLFWVLKWLYAWVGNWGVAIILLTIIIKALFYPLSAASYRSMARMRILTPKLQKLKEQYGNDRQRMNQAMMELYRTEKINPLGGCLPVVVQIPVFIALYWVLLASVELRHVPFILWIDDLSTPDPYFVLPVLMGATMIFQTYLNPVPPDPVQAKVMKIMPIAFSVFFFFFPAGLVLYWLINNILSIAQQWQITRAMENSKPGHAK